MANKSTDYQQIQNELNELALETFGLWDQDRVGFRWKHYLPNHTQRVRAICLELGRREGANKLALSFAATLHDITKPYDGEIHTDIDGNRILDENGFWKNEVLLPARSNIVTELYDSNNLYSSMHHISGAFIARKILEGYGLGQDFVDNVCSIIAAHVKPLSLTPEKYNHIYGKVEHQIIYDADTMDANLGYVAFFRNIHIHAPKHLQNGSFNIARYITSIEPWINLKQSFADGLFTRLAREMGEKRQRRKQQLYQQLVTEQNNPDLNMKYGMLGVLNYFVSQTGEPNFGKELLHLQQSWIPERERWLEQDSHGSDSEQIKQSLQRVTNFCKTLGEEAAGKK
jgi:hypothetical protein